MHKKTLIALDIDGTLSDFGGPISKQTIDRLKQVAHVGICSSRSDAWDIARRYGLGFGETGKSNCLTRFKQLWGRDCVGFLYIADTKADEEEARKAGFNFVNVNDIKLNLGCGEDIRHGYINIDIRPLEGVNIVLDLESQSLPFEDGIVSEIVAQDVIEHIHYHRVENLLRECHRVLRHGGTLYIRTPDLERIVDKVLVKKECLGQLSGYKLLSFFIFGRYDNPYDVHKCIFTKPLLKEVLEEIGFKIIELKNDNSNLICVCVKQ